MHRVVLSLAFLLLAGACSDPTPGSGLGVSARFSRKLQVECVKEAFKPLFRGAEPKVSSRLGWGWTPGRYERRGLSWKTEPVEGVGVDFSVEWRDVGDESDELVLWNHLDEEAWQRLGRMDKIEFAGQWELRRTVLFEMLNTLSIRCKATHDKGDLRVLCEGESCKELGKLR